jgi:hypothetical protein
VLACRLLVRLTHRWFFNSLQVGVPFHGAWPGRLNRVGMLRCIRGRKARRRVTRHWNACRGNACASSTWTPGGLTYVPVLAEMSACDV